MKNIVIMIIIILLFMGFIFIDLNPKRDIINQKSNQDYNENHKEIIIPNETGSPIAVFFCPKDNCTIVLLNLIENSDEIVCAIYDLNLPEIINALERKKAKIVVDDNYYEKSYGKITNLKKDTTSQYMHNKFCVFDKQIVFTGSFNPSPIEAVFNNNNVLVFDSIYLAKNYLDEFEELWNGIYGKGEKVVYDKIIFNNILIENFFCPEDSCAKRTINILESANETIYFMQFSFTDKNIANTIIKKYNNGIDVKGVMEKRSITKDSVFNLINDTIGTIKHDKNPRTMHNKVFIIDEKIVITGSYNPSKSGDSRNDENVIVIHDKEIAQLYVNEFIDLYEY
jgi:phosphatidylserine/phosphatidylglycerophosphate/cardiolipin synthase-like enzyme